MLRIVSFLCFCAFASPLAFAQTLTIQPYLQDASPHTISIIWETSSADESTIEWGLSEALGNTTVGSSINANGNSMIHTVNIDNLQRFTKYYYRVKSPSIISPIYAFKTPPFAADKENFRIVAMSDMQQDGAFPNKFQEIVNDGVIDYLNSETEGDLIDNLALVMIPGDLVSNGNNYNSWAQTFFNPAQNLFNQIPVYPVPGNHENNSAFFFQYFKLPTNGIAGFEEHNWYKDYGNVRIVGLDSNGAIDNQAQLDWLEEIMDNTCSSDSIDFVFAQLHHPHKSELWTPGESNFTGEVINVLEQFSTACGKPSLHLFGHTHGYSRGQSRDHKHLWINVATAGGAIDNWGEFPNADYEEFAVSQDEYGFVSLEITADEDPRVIIKKIGRGDQDAVVDNELRDSFVIRLNSTLVNSPNPLYPNNETLAPECVELKASAFASPSAQATHGQSHWQVSLVEDDFTNPVAESWKNFENWYFEEDTQAGDDLTDEMFTGLSALTNYWWRVRYRDRELNWSEWTTPTPFATSESIALPNLLLNFGAEDSLSNWVIQEGVVESLTDGICDGISPYSGTKYFAVGGLCEHSEVGRCTQDVDVSMYADSIDTGIFSVNFGGRLSNYSGSDLPEMKLFFLDEAGFTIGESNTIATLNPYWTSLNETTIFPTQTRIVQVALKGTRNGGTDNDSYFDELYLTAGTNSIECAPINSIATKTKIPTLTVVPNPVKGNGIIKAQHIGTSDAKLDVVSITGQKIPLEYEFKNGQFHFQTKGLAAGTYVFWVRANGKLMGTGKIIVL